MAVIRTVIDTNVFVSGLISPKGSPRKVLELAREGIFKAVTPISINHEIFEVLHRDYIYNKYGLTEEIVDDIASLLYEGTILTEDSYKIQKVKKDPEDNKFIACAIEGEADYIVSGDGHLLNLKHYKGIQIVDANSFLEILEKRVR
ncbi:MAG: putative toxin-antitoxin system toxin component, PIN family [Thermodesulfovibrionales bacterium]|nr:putative toxin-antitoxin system toxin component, PIN family [Thermodesulfovibrionales bacterium]